MNKIQFLLILTVFTFFVSYSQPTNLDFSSGNINGWTLQQGGNQDAISEIINNIHASTEYTVLTSPTAEINGVPISMTSPLGGNFVRIGQPNAGGNTYILSQTFTVDATSQTLLFNYATVMDNGGHSCSEQNYFDFKIKDAGGNIIPPNTYNQSILNGFSCSSGDPSYITYSHFGYKNWTNLSYDLANYIGNPITIEFFVAGCSMYQGAHAGYAYFDAAVCSNSFTPSSVTVNGNSYPLSQLNNTINVCHSYPTVIWAPVGATTFSWSGGAINGLTTQSVSIAQPGNYHLSCNKPFACSNTTEVNFKISTSPTLAITSSTNNVCPGIGRSLTVSGANTYTWSALSGTSQGVGNGSTYYVYPQVASVYQVLGKDIYGCVASSNYTASVLASPSVSISVIGNTLSCVPGSSISLMASGADSYTWGTGANTSAIVVSPTVSTTYSVVGTLLSSGCTNYYNHNISFATALNLGFNKNKVCIGDSATLYGSGATSYTWSNGATTNVIVVKPTVTTTYTLSAQTYSCGLQQSVITITVNPLPNIQTTSPSTLSCPGLYLFSASGGISYIWSNGMANNTTLYLNSNTSHTVTGTDANGCVNKSIQSYTTFPVPTITVVTTPTLICAGQQATLTAFGPSTYTWSNGGNAASTVVTPTVNINYSINASDINGCVVYTVAPTVFVSQTTPSFAFAYASYSFCANNTGFIQIVGSNTDTYSCGQPGTSIDISTSSRYLVIQPPILAPTVYTVTGSNACGVYTKTLTASSYPLPTMSVSGPTITCENNPITYTVGGVNSFNISPTGVYTSSTLVTVTPTINTVYSINGYGANGCSVNQTVSVTVNSGLSVPVNTYTICSGASQTLTASGANSYTWSTGANTNSIIVTPTASAVYTITGSSSNSCVITKTISVTINPAATFTVNSSSVCLGNIFVMNPTGAYGNSYSYSSVTASVTPATNSSYTVFATNSYSCNTSAVSSVTVNPIPNIAVNSGSICAGESFTMNPNGGNFYVYSSGNSIVSPTVSTNYTITGSDVNGCINTAVSSVAISGSVPVITVNSGTICSGSNFTINPTGASTYTYSSGAAVVNPTITTTYTVTADGSLGCVGTASAVCSVMVNPTPTITVNSGTICSNQNFTITPSGADTYTFSAGSNIVITPLNNTMVTVTGTDVNGCKDNVGAISTISVNPIPILNASASSSVVCDGSSVQLNSSGANAYAWSTGATTASVLITPTVTNTYTVTGTGINNCSSTETVSVLVSTICSDVWPGDANSDGWADNLDVLELGLHYLQTGAARPSGLSNTWQSHFANNWSGTISNGKNINHSDCNGDGTINDDDTLAIFNNYGLAHAFRSPTQIATIPELSILPNQPMVAKGAWGSSNIYLGDAVADVNDINGIAFTVNFDNMLIEPNSIWLEYPNSFINTANQNLHFRKLDFLNNNLFTATTHTINNNVSGNGLIGILHYQILSSLTTDQVLNIGLVQGYKSQTSGLVTPLTVGSGTIMAIGASVGISDNLNYNFISISPNPTNGMISIRSKMELQKVELIAVTGQILISETPTTNNHNLYLDNLANGIYFVNLYQNNRVVKREKVVLNK